MTKCLGKRVASVAGDQAGGSQGRQAPAHTPSHLHHYLVWTDIQVRRASHTKTSGGGNYSSLFSAEVGPRWRLWLQIYEAISRSGSQTTRQTVAGRQGSPWEELPVKECHLAKRPVKRSWSW